MVVSVSVLMEPSRWSVAGRPGSILAALDIISLPVWGSHFPQLEPFNNAAESKCELVLRTEPGAAFPRSVRGRRVPLCAAPPHCSACLGAALPKSTSSSLPRNHTFDPAKSHLAGVHVYCPKHVVRKHGRRRHTRDVYYDRRHRHI